MNTMTVSCGQRSFLPDFGLLVEFLKLIPFLLIAVPSNRRNIQHPIAEFNECTAFYWNVQVRNVMQAEIDDPFQLLLTKLRSEIGLSNHLPLLVRNQSVLHKNIVIVRDDCRSTCLFSWLKVNPSHTIKYCIDWGCFCYLVWDLLDCSLWGSSPRGHFVLSLAYATFHALCGLVNWRLASLIHRAMKKCLRFGPSCSDILMKSDPPTMPTFKYCTKDTGKSKMALPNTSRHIGKVHKQLPL